MEENSHGLTSGSSPAICLLSTFNKINYELLLLFPVRLYQCLWILSTEVSKRYAAVTTMIPDMIITMWTDTENSEYLKAVKANPQ